MSRVALRPVYSDTTQLDVELSCVVIDTLTDATQLSPAIGNVTDPVEAYSLSARSRSVELSCVAINGPLVFLVHESVRRFYVDRPK